MSFFARGNKKCAIVLFLAVSIMTLTATSSSWADFAFGQSTTEKLVAVYHCDYPPVSFLDTKTGKPSGFFVDIMDNIARRARLQVSYICKNGWPEMISAIESSEADLGLLLKSEEREKKLLFSSPVDITYLSFFSRSQSSIDVDSLPPGYVVGVIKGSMSYDQLKNRKGLQLHMVDSYQAGIFSLLAGETGLFAGEESMILKRAREARLDDRIRKTGKPFVERERGFVVRKDNVRLLASLNQSLSGFVGSLAYQDIYVRWYGTPAPYWTGRRILIASSFLLLIAVCGMALWRYLSLSTINKDLVLQISERKRAEDALKNSEAFVKNILETVDEGFIVIDRDYKILSANQAYCNQVHLPLDAVLGHHCYEISHKLHKPCYEAGEDCAVRRTFETNEPYTTVHTHHGETGLPIFVEIKSYPIRNESGEVLSAIEIVNDITEKRKLEDQLRHAQKMEAVGQLAGGIAHDFNNILTAIIGYGSIMKLKMNEGEPLRYNLQQMLDAAERASNLTRGLLTFSRKQVISPRLINLNDIVTNVEKLLQRVIGEDVELKVIRTENELAVMADSGQMEQILMNLATNARDAMPAGGQLIIRTEFVELGPEFIRLHGYGQPGNYALISVLDTGIGIDEKTREKIFEPFFTTKEVGKGTGLGLSIVYGIVKQHNGYITCSSEPNKGSLFTIYLPIVRGVYKKIDDAALLPVRGGTETVLIAEDDVAVKTLLNDLLVQQGYSVIMAGDGEEAVDKYRQNRDAIQLLILDIIMPKKNGKDVFEEIQKDRPDIKAIFISGYTADIMREQHTLKAGMNFLSKPIAPNELLLKVRTVLDHK